MLAKIVPTNIHSSMLQLHLQYMLLSSQLAGTLVCGIFCFLDGSTTLTAWAWSYNGSVFSLWFGGPEAFQNIVVVTTGIA